MSVPQLAAPLRPWRPEELLPTHQRQVMSSRRWDLVVIGAGITGAGVARDAAMRGLKVLVLEARDVAWGSSSRSTRLIHGGVRYLEQGELGLVYEALRERSLLYRLAGHLVKPTRFIFPTFRGDRLSPFLLRAGLGLYDALNLWRSAGHRWLRPQIALDREPALRSEGLRGAVEYEDAVTDDARLTLTVLQSARAHGAEVLTYCPVQSIEGELGQHDVVVEGGHRVAARQVVIATGPWTSARLFGQAAQGLMAASKGVHVVVPSSRLKVRHPVVVQVPGAPRILFVVPWGERTYLGTTDTAYEGDLNAPDLNEREELEILELCGRVVRFEGLTRADVISGWSGVRPLVRSARAQRRGDISTLRLARTHRLIENAQGVLAIVGGKLTTYRSMSQEAVDRVCARMPRVSAQPGQAGSQLDEGRALRPSGCVTHKVALVDGGAITQAELDGDPLLRALVDRHGPTARDLTRAARESPALAEQICDDLPYRWVEVDQALSHEGVFHLDDLLRRRLPLALVDRDLGARVARRIATRLVDLRGGDQSDIDHELERYAELVAIETGRRPHIT